MTPIQLTVDGEPVAAVTGATVAAALLAAGRLVVARSAKYHRPRGAFCLTGSCFQCLVRINGEPNQRACLRRCEPGMLVETQNALPSAKHDLLAVTDLLFPEGLDHHHLGVKLGKPLNRMATEFARSLSGLGRFPTASSKRILGNASPPMESDAIIVGGGPAGLSAAERLLDEGLRIVLIEGRAVGGRLRSLLGCDDGEQALRWAEHVAKRISFSSGELWEGWEGVGVWQQSSGRVLAARQVETGELKLFRSSRWIIATGGMPQPPPFENGDRPGIFSARGICTLLADHRLKLSGSAVVVKTSSHSPGADGDDGFAEASSVAEALVAAGATPVTVEKGIPRRAQGRARLTEVTLADGRHVSANFVVIVAALAPAFELLRLMGATVQFDQAEGFFRPVVDAHGGTGVRGLWAAGEVLRPMKATDARRSGLRAAEAALQ